MQKIKELGLIISSISVILTVIVLAIKYISNIPYRLIQKPLGIKKNDKADSIILLILICAIFIVFLLVAIIVFWSIGKHKNTVSYINKTSILVLIHLLGSIVLWWILFIKNKEFNKSILKFADINDKIKSEKYSKYSIWHLIFIIIIDSFVLVGYIEMPGVNQGNTICLMISIVISVILAIITSSRFELKASLMSLQDKTIYVVYSKVPLRQCKVIWANKEYICIYKDSKITYINNKDILKIKALNLSN